jgi:hypothetical protein
MINKFYTLYSDLYKITNKHFFYYINENYLFNKYYYFEETNNENNLLNINNYILKCYNYNKTVDKKYKELIYNIDYNNTDLLDNNNDLNQYPIHLQFYQNQFDKINIDEFNNYKFIIKYNSFNDNISLILYNKLDYTYNYLINSEQFDVIIKLFENIKKKKNNKFAIVPYINIIDRVKQFEINDLIIKMNNLNIKKKVINKLNKKK